MFEVWATIGERTELIRCYPTKEEAEKATQLLSFRLIPDYIGPNVIAYRGGIPGLKLIVVDNQTDREKQ